MNGTMLQSIIMFYEQIALQNISTSWEKFR